MSFLKLKKYYPMTGAYRAFKPIASYGKNRNEAFVGISYSMVATPDAARAFEVVPERYRKHFYLALMEINTFIPPHIDTGVLATINFYIKPDGCTTQFYRFKDPENVTRVGTKGYVYDLSELEDTVHFTAEKDSVYLLDTTVPHAVWDMGDEVRGVQMDLVKLFADAHVDTPFDLARRDLNDPPVIRDQNGNILDLPCAYRDTHRIALCLQTVKYGFSDVADMLSG
jgi:hypothetical protein